MARWQVKGEEECEQCGTGKNKNAKPNQNQMNDNGHEEDEKEPYREEGERWGEGEGAGYYEKEMGNRSRVRDATTSRKNNALTKANE